VGRPRLKLTGERFGTRVVIAEAGQNAHQAVLWHWRCDCGKEGAAPVTDLRRGKSCGCVGDIVNAEKHTKHGMCFSPEYYAYHAAKDRCSNPKAKSWKDYGGRGIRFLFTSFEQFMAEIGPRPDGKSLDRIENNGNYEPGNVRWATMSEQVLNQRPVTEERRQRLIARLVTARATRGRKQNANAAQAA
jgi:hypothetical protein